MLAPLSALAGFGISPPLIQEERLVPGSRFERTIYLVQGNPERDLGIEVTVDSRDIKDWITFNPGTVFTIPSGVQQFPLKVLISVPQDAPLGIYTAFIRTKTVPVKADEDGEVAIALGGRIDVKLEIGDDVFREIAIKNIDIHDIKETDKPRISIRVANTGNVASAPEGVTFELFNKFGDLRLAYAESEFREEVPSFSELVSDIEFPIDVRLAPGEYWGHVKVYDAGAVIKESRTVFNVRERTLFDALLIPAIAASGFLLLILIAFLVWKRIRRRR
jgi:hypothetical protein